MGCFGGQSRSPGIISGHLKVTHTYFPGIRSLKSLYLLMATVGELLPGLNQREKMPSFILEGSRHRTSSRPSRKLSFSEKNVIFDENLWFFEKNFELKIILGKFYIMFTQPILGTSSHFKIGVSLAIHSSFSLLAFSLKL